MKKKATLLRSFMKNYNNFTASDTKMEELRIHFIDVASQSQSATNLNKKHNLTVMKSNENDQDKLKATDSDNLQPLPTTKENLNFRISFDPVNGDNETKIKFPNGKTVTSDKKEVKKNLIRAVIKACVENNMKKKAKLLRSFMKDDITFSSSDKKMDELRKN